MTQGPENGSGLAADSGERYERGERIATGGMGEVWRARDTVLGREVAVKVLKNEYADDPTFRARFEAEARHAAGLHHPGIASVFDYGLLKDGATPYLVMELVDGKPLSDLLAEGRPFDPEQARVLALQTAEALAVAHAAGVIHRDVKPGNLLVTPDGRVKITDFGIARAAGSVAFTQTGQIVGTPHYLSPEQAHGQSATAASDVYALAVVLYECLSGRRPFSADTPIATALAHIQQDVPPLPDTVPPALAAVVTRALAKDPAARYADGADFAVALRGAAPDAAPLAAPLPVDTSDHTQVLGAAAAPVAAAGLAGAAGAPPPGTTATPVATPEPTADRRSRGPVYAGIVLVLLLLAALLITRPWSQDSTGSDSNGGDSSSDTVRVRRGAYVGEPVGQVRAALKELGLKTRVESSTNPGDEEAGTVADLSPTGTVDKGSTITLQVWDEASSDEPTSEPTDSESPGKPEKSDKPEKPAKPEKTEKTDPPGKPAPSDVTPTDTTTATAAPNADAGPTDASTSTGNGRVTDTGPGSGSKKGG